MRESNRILSRKLTMLEIAQAAGRDWPAFGAGRKPRRLFRANLAISSSKVNFRGSKFVLDGK